ncbi:PREDICTED: diphthamide biosynthesis protein 2 [Ceratosolen solmsi marchali]|uniref:2-(3-amino-3-carboxypropyl)histidine synthase subunit 2 n=1 Tax=Ceratosolen solmsi marchali TaxID=326594 RepID=A0AAJ6YCN4_9HYME|nr:PREDICTED: diphthamide biosynthesis protein 2 [Ceratosolen solmsi marchali]
MIELEECGNWIKKSSFQKICLQIPDYLMHHAVEIILNLQKYSSAFLYVIGDTSYDNCCIDKLTVNRFEADACIHFGHACLSCTNHLPTFHVFQKKYFDIELFCKEFNEYFKDESKEILLFYDTSFTYIIEHIYEKLYKKYKNLIFSILKCISNVPFSKIHPNESHKSIIGRQYSLPSEHQLNIYDAVFLGPNDKTLLTLFMSLPVNACHYFDGSKIYKFNMLKSLWFKRRNFLIEKIRDATTFGIIIASLNVENYLAITEMLKSILNKVGKKVYTFNVGKISPTKLGNFHQVDIFVAITCPESSLIDSRDYLKPIVTPFEVELAFNDLREFSLLHELDFKQILPGGTNYKNFDVTSKPDISLICGKSRQINSSDITINNTLTHKERGTLKNNEININCLNSRTWNGLEQKLGENHVKLAENGRNGIPINYENESI